MAGYVWHIIHGYECFANIPAEVKAKMPADALRSIIIGTIVPDLTKGKSKSYTHFCVPHPEYGSDYAIPDMEAVNRLFLKKDPTCLGVLSHLKYDVDHINSFLVIYGKPCGNDEIENTVTGEKMSKLEWFGNGKDVYGQLYQLYDKFNGEMAVKYMPKLNEAFGMNFSSDKNGFLNLMRWLFPGKMPLSGIPDMDDYRTTDDIHGILRTFFDKDGSGCVLKAEMDDLQKIVLESSKELAKTITKLYENE